MNLTKTQTVCGIILLILFLMIFSCRNSCNRRDVEKAVIKHEVREELKKRKEHIIEKLPILHRIEPK